MNSSKFLDFLSKQESHLDSDLFKKPNDPWISILLEEERHKIRLEFVRMLSEGIAFKPTYRQKSP